MTTDALTERLPERQRRRWRWPLPVVMAARELRSGLTGFRIFIACLALGVGAIAAVGTLSAALQASLAREGRVLLGGDMSLSLIHRQASPQELAFMAARAEISRIATMRAMAQLSPDGKLALVEIKAIDERYPLVGAVAFDGDMTLAKLRAGGGVAVEELLLERLGAKVGDRLKIGEAEVKIAAILISEPDRLSGGPTFGPRVLMPLEDLEATGLNQPGSLIRWHYRLLFPEGADKDELAAFRKALDTQFAQSGFRVLDSSDPTPGLRSVIDRFAQFLTLVGLTALLVGGVGVANSVASFVESKHRVIAALKCLGASHRLVFQTYLLQVLVLAAAGVVLGLALGVGLIWLASALLAGLLPIPLAVTIDPATLLLAALYGLLTALLFTLWPLGKTRDVRAAALLRDSVTGETRAPKTPVILASAAIALALGGTAVALSDAKLIALGFSVGLIAVFGLFLGLSTLLVRLVRRLPRPRNTALALALTSLKGPGSLSRSITLSLGSGLTLLSAISLIDSSLVDEFETRLPDRAPSYYFLDIPKDGLADFEARIAQAFPQGKLSTAPMLRGRIVALKGTPVTELTPPGNVAWVLRGDRGLTYAQDLPKGSRLVSGAWWPADYTGEPLVSFEAEIAEGLGLKVGDEITVNVLGRNLTARIANLRTLEWESLTINFVMIFSPNALAAAPHTMLATLTIPPDMPGEGAAIQRVIEADPKITAIRVADALEAVNGIVQRVITGIRAAGGVTLLAGAIVLAGALATAQRRRVYEAVVFKTLGATRGRILAAHMIEFGILALATAVLAAALGTLGAYVTLTQVMDARFVFDPMALVEAALLAMVLVVGFGVVGTWRVLSAKAAPHLRSG